MPVGLCLPSGRSASRVSCGVVAFALPEVEVARLARRGFAGGRLSSVGRGVLDAGPTVVKRSRSSLACDIV